MDRRNRIVGGVALGFGLTVFALLVKDVQWSDPSSFKPLKALAGSLAFIALGAWYLIRGVHAEPWTSKTIPKNREIPERKERLTIGSILAGLKNNPSFQAEHKKVEVDLREKAAKMEKFLESEITQLKRDAKELPIDFDKTELLRDLEAMIEDSRRTDDLVKQTRDDEARAAMKQRKLLFLAMPIFSFGSYVVVFHLLATSIITGVAKGKNHNVSAAAEPLHYWTIVMFQATASVILVAATIWCLWRLLTTRHPSHQTPHREKQFFKKY